MIKKLRARIKLMYSVLTCKGCVVVYSSQSEADFQILSIPLKEVPLMLDQTADLIEYILAHQESESLGEQMIRDINKN